MGNEILTEMKSHTLTEFWGGDHRGVCIQISSVDSDRYIVLTMEEASALVADLTLFIKEEAIRRQLLLSKEISRLKDVENTVFKEVVELNPDLWTIPRMAVDLVSQFCPRSEKTNEAST